MLTGAHRSVKCLSIGCLLLSAVLFAVPSHSQSRLSEILISVDIHDQPLTDLLAAIYAKSGVPFSYNPKKIQTEQRVTYTAVNQPLTLVLNELSRVYGWSYRLVENQIILRPEKTPDKPPGQTLTVSGYAKDRGSGEALIGANVFIKELQTGVACNAFGFYSMTIPKGKYTLACSFVGYKEFTVTLELNSPIKQDLLLEEERPLLQEIVISGGPPNVVEDVQTSKVNLRPETVKERPAMLGEMDVVKSLESIPGIKLHSDGSTFYSVRGGNRDQNMVLIDDAPIYNPSHLLGFFSTIIPDAINDITVYKGNMPASLGGRLSSVMDVRTRNGNDQHLQGWGNTGIISTKLGVEGPIKKNASSFLVSLRVSRLKWFFQQINHDITQFNFYDFTAKTNFKLNPANRIYFSLYTGADNFFTSSNGIAWTNTAGSFRWNHLFNDRLFMNVTLAAGGYDYSLYVNVANDTKWTSHVANVTLKTDFSYFIRPQNELTFGFAINGYNFNPGNIQSRVPIRPIPTVSVRNSGEFILYGNHEIKRGPHWGLNYGARISSWTNTGPSFEFLFDPSGNPTDTLYFEKGQNYKTFFNVEPRLTVSYTFNEQSALKASYSRNVQNIHLISNSISPFTSLEVWLPSSINVLPQAANQVTFGYYHTLTGIGTSLTAETFYKKMTHQIDYIDHAQTLLNPLLERELRFGRTTVYGIELFAKKETGRLRGSAGYSFSRAKSNFSDINEGRTFNAFYDRPHQITLMMAYDITLRWNLGMNWNYSTGTPFSSPVNFFSYNGQEVPVYGQKNNDRLPAYHRMDVSATFKLNKNPERKFQHSLSFSIFNLYGRKNALFINYNKTESGDGSFKIPANLLDANRQTTQYYLFHATPSVTYNFKWL